METDVAALVRAVCVAIDATVAEYGRMPFFVRPMVRRGFVKRTGHDPDEWARLLDAAARGVAPPGLADALGRLAEHYEGAPERARRGMGGRPEELAEVERRSRERAASARALAATLQPAG